MKVKIGSIEISDITLEELDELVNRYGASNVESGGDVRVQSSSEGRGTAGGSTHADHVLLQRMVAAGNTGVAAQEVGEILQRRGKALPSAVEAWSRRIGLKEGNFDPFEPCRVGTRKHIRIKQAVSEVARRLAAQHR